MGRTRGDLCVWLGRGVLGVFFLLLAPAILWGGLANRERTEALVLAAAGACLLLHGVRWCARRTAALGTVRALLALGLFGDHVLVPVVLNVLLSTLSGVLLFFLGKRLMGMEAGCTALALWGVVRMVRSRDRSGLFLPVIYGVGLTLSQLLVEVAGRYHYSILPVLILLAVRGLQRERPQSVM